MFDSTAISCGYFFPATVISGSIITFGMFGTGVSPGIVRKRSPNRQTLAPVSSTKSIVSPPISTGIIGSFSSRICASRCAAKSGTSGSSTISCFS